MVYVIIVVSFVVRTSGWVPKLRHSLGESMTNSVDTQKICFTLDSSQVRLS